MRKGFVLELINPSCWVKWKDSNKYLHSIDVDQQLLARQPNNCQSTNNNSTMATISFPIICIIVNLLRNDTCFNIMKSPSPFSATQNKQKKKGSWTVPRHVRHTTQQKSIIASTPFAFSPNDCVPHLRFVFSRLSNVPSPALFFSFALSQFQHPLRPPPLLLPSPPLPLTQPSQSTCGKRKSNVCGVY